MSFALIRKHKALSFVCASGLMTGIVLSDGRRRLDDKNRISDYVEKLCMKRYEEWHGQSISHSHWQQSSRTTSFPFGVLSQILQNMKLCTILWTNDVQKKHLGYAGTRIWYWILFLDDLVGITSNLVKWYRPLSREFHENGLIHYHYVKCFCIEEMRIRIKQTPFRFLPFLE